MDCRNCGAPMELFERRRYYFCRYCGSFEFLGSTATDGITVLRRAGDVACPVCAAPLASALLDDGHPVYHCEQCKGVLMARRIFASVVERRRAAPTGPPASPVPIDQRELRRRLACPACRAPMAVHPYYGPGNVVIDTCDLCDAVWVDAGEMQDITDAPGRDRGPGWQ